MNNSEKPVPVAIIGMGCFFPKADDVRTYWANICQQVDAIEDIPESHWKADDYFHTDPKHPDHTYARRGAFLSPVAFPPLEFGITPNSLEATDTTQLLGLLAAKQALDHAGYDKQKQFDRDRVSVILGVTGTLPLVIPLGARLGHPLWRKALEDAGVEKDTADDVVQRIADSYVGWQEESFPGLLGNVAAGRIANRLNLGGTNCVVDAACASSLSAIHLAMLELQTGRCDMALSGGFDTFNDIFMYMCFSKTPALSPTGNAKPFAADGDGTILGEGLGCLLLKRLPEAERDGDTIYAVIRSIGTSSDGKGQAIYAPSSAGQMKALKSAYDQAGISPDTIELVEAHGTGTKAGDSAEVRGLTEVYRESKSAGTWCALGSVKSQIGHTKAAAGSAGLLKAALALHHKVLPPTIKVEQPLEMLQPHASPFYVNTQQRPWLPQAHPRRAAVSSFGFGGSNFHCVLEEYQPKKHHITWDGDVQIAAFSADTLNELRQPVESLLAESDWTTIARLSANSRAAFRTDDPCRLVLVLHKRQDRARLVRQLEGKWHSTETNWSLPDGVTFASGPKPGKLAFVFPGQGAQYVGMLRDMTCHFPTMLDTLADANVTFADNKRLSDYLYPQPVFDEQARTEQELQLRATQIAQPALGAVSLGAARVLRHFGIYPDTAVGHSFGELTALCVAGVVNDTAFRHMACERGRLMAEVSGGNGSMLAVRLSASEVEAIVQTHQLDVTIANKNAPQQTVLSATNESIQKAADVLKGQGISCQPLPVGAAFHSPMVAEASGQLATVLESMDFRSPIIPVYANSTGDPYPADASAAKNLLANQLARPVEFIRCIENLYAEGVRTFVEVGPSNKLSGLVRSILSDRDHQTTAIDAGSGKSSGMIDLARTLAQLAALGHPVDLTRWEEGAETAERPTKKTHTVMLSGANHVAPKKTRPPLQKTADKPTAKPSNGTLNHNEPPQPQPAKPTRSPQPVQAISRPATPMSQAKVPAPTANGQHPSQVTPQSQQFAQQGLQALQSLSEQTAELHRKFLEGQDRTLQVFQTLLLQQQGLPAPSIPEPVSNGHYVAPPPPVPQAPPTVPEPTVSRISPAISTPQPPPTQQRPEVAPTPEAPKPEVPQPQPATNAWPLVQEVVAEKTGYPPEMLEETMELDADLGIDSIKRVEIFSALQERLPDAPPLKSEEMGAIRTLADVLAFLGESQTYAEPAPVRTTTAAPQQPAPATPPTQTNGQHLEILLSVIAEKTGYPPEMLEETMELDADLGIDSIKRVEIFSALQERIPDSPVAGSDQVGSLRTIADVTAFLTNGEPVSSTAAVASEPTVEPEIPTTSAQLQRYLLELVPEEGNGHRTELKLPKGSMIAVAGPEDELTKRVCDRLQLQGFVPKRLSVSDSETALDLSNIHGLVLIASAEPTDADFLRMLTILQSASPVLRSAQGEAFVVTVSRMDGTFGIRNATTNPLSGGMAGFAKTLSWEWPNVHCKAIDLAADLDSEEAAGALTRELFLQGPLEVGINREGCWTIRLNEQGVPSGGTLPLQPRDVVIVTGGARGVTAEIAVSLAKRVQPTLILLGRSPLPEAEPDWLTSLSQEADIKRGLLQHSDSQPSPRELDEQYRRLLAAREIRDNLERIRQAGADVHYYRADVRDESAVSALVREITNQHGPIMGLIHGAGVIADRKIEDKTTEQFCNVYDTKVVGLRSLLSALSEQPLQLLAVFSSSTARFGRTGQVDYAVANEVLNKLAQCEAQKRPQCRVVSVNWGPWDGGMVQGGLKSLFRNEGLSLIPLQAGSEYLLDELCVLPPAQTETVILGPGSQLPMTKTSVSKAQVETSNTPPKSSSLSLAFTQEVSIDRVPVLKSHVLQGKAVVPAALLAEWFAQSAVHAHPGLAFHGLEEFRIYQGVKLDGGQQAQLRFSTGSSLKRDGGFAIPVEVVSTGHGKDVRHAAAVAVLGNKPLTAPVTGQVPTFPAIALSVDEVYRNQLFHGQELQGITEIQGLSENGFVARVQAVPNPSNWIQRPLRQSWLLQPLALDCAFQMMIVWCREQFGMPSLPTHWKQYRQYVRSFPREDLIVSADIRETSNHHVRADLRWFNESGRALAEMIGYECVMDGQLTDSFRHNHLTSETVTSQ